MTKEFDETRAKFVAQSEAMATEIRGLQTQIAAIINAQEKIDARIEGMDLTHQLLATASPTETYMRATGGGDGVGGPSGSTGEKHAINPRHARSTGREPKEAAAPKEKQKRPPVARPVREFLRGYGPATSLAIIVALQKQGIPKNSIENYFPRGVRNGEIVRDNSIHGVYSLPGQEMSDQVAEAENLDEGMDEVADQANQHQGKPPKTIVETLDIIHRAGTYGINKEQLKLANALDAAETLRERGEVEVDDDGIFRVFHPIDSEDAAE